MAKPWFKFYVPNFVDATYSWKPGVVGIYLRLLLYQYSHGAIPKETEEILEICNCTIEEWNIAWKKLSKKFHVTDDGAGFVNQKMESARAEAELSYARRVAAAEKSHESRRNNKNELQSNCNANELQMQGASGSGSGSKKFASEIEEVFSHYQASRPTAKLGEKNKSQIRDRLKEEFSVEDCKLAIDGNHNSPFHAGDNDQQRKYQSLDLIFRTADKTNAFIELAECRSTSRNPSKRSEPTTFVEQADANFKRQAAQFIAQQQQIQNTVDGETVDELPRIS